MGNYRYLDMETYRRRAHFEYFSGLAYPYVGVTVQVDLTELLRKIRMKSCHFSLPSVIAYPGRPIGRRNSVSVSETGKS